MSKLQFSITWRLHALEPTLSEKAIPDKRRRDTQSREYRSYGIVRLPK